MTDDWSTFSSLAELRIAIDGGRVSSVEATQAVLRRIDETEPKINAYVTVDHDGSLVAAAAMDF